MKHTTCKAQDDDDKRMDWDIVFEQLKQLNTD